MRRGVSNVERGPDKELYEVYEYHLFDGGNGNYFIARGKEVPTTDN